MHGLCLRRGDSVHRGRPTVRSMLRALSSRALTVALIVSVLAAIPSFASRSLAASQPAPDPTHPPATQPVELTGLRTADSVTFLLPNGDRQAVVYPGPVNYLDAHGAYQPIDDTLVASSAKGFAFENRANSYAVRLPSSLASPVQVATGGASLSFALEGAAGTVSTRSNVASYDNAFAGVNVAYTVGNAGVKETLALADAQAPATFTYDVAAVGATLHASDSGGADVLDGAGSVIAQLEAPTITDANSASGPIRMSVTNTAVTVTADAAWLADPARAWPVTIDPTVTFSGSGQVTDCWIGSAAATTSHCADTTLGVGYDGTNKQRALLQFPTLASTIPYDSLVYNATLQAYVTAKTTANTVQIDARRVTSSTNWNSSVTWNTKDGTNAWSTAGGDYDTTSGWPYATSGYSATGLGGGTGVWASWYMTKLVQDWAATVDADQNSAPTVSEYGVLLKQSGETTNQLLSFASTEYSDTSKYPKLTVVYNPRSGNDGSQNFQKYHLDDRMTAEVNDANGNLLIVNNDIRIPGVDGMDLKVSRHYNSIGDAQGTWTWQLGPDQQVQKQADGSVTYRGPSFYRAAYIKTDATPTFKTPAGQNTKMVLLGNGDYQLTENKSSKVYEFKEQVSGSGNFNLISATDRNGNQITLSYVSGTARLNQITDTHGVTLTATYTSGNLTKLQDSTGRSWQYHYNAAGLIDTYTDPESHVTTYVYNGSNVLTEIDTPDGRVTKIGTDANGRVSSVAQIYDNSNVAGTTLTTTFAYYPTYNGTFCGSTQPTGSKGCTTVTDPNTNVSKFSYDARDRVIDVRDGANKERKNSFTANNDTDTYTDATNVASTNTYDTDSNLTKVQLPVSGESGSSAAETDNAYSDTTHGNNKYLPTSETDAQGNCTRLVYDTTHGDATDVYAAITPTASGGNFYCDATHGSTGTSSYHFTYARNGITDPLTSTTPSCTNATTGELCNMTNPQGFGPSYSYDTAHRVSTITWPANRNAWSYTYDSLSRIATFTNGRSQVTRYAYDKLDRITQIAYNGTTLPCTVGASTCITYSYDVDGNLTQRDDDYGTTVFDFDDMGRIIRNALPSGSDGCASDTHATKGMLYTYDGANNLQTLCNALGTTTYSYNASNYLTRLLEPGGNCATDTFCINFTEDDAGRYTKIAYTSTLAEWICRDPGAASFGTCLNSATNGPIYKIKNVTSATASTEYDYSYSKGGTQDTSLVWKVTQKDNGVTGNTTTYSNGGTNRLLSAVEKTSGGTTVHNWVYTIGSDSNFSHTQATGATDMWYGTDDADQQCWTKASTTTVTGTCAAPPSGATTWTADGDGNQTGNSAGLASVYNSKGQTTSITPAGGSAVTYTYADADQTLLTSRTTGGVTTTYDNGILGIDHQSAGGSYFIRDNHGRVLGYRSGTLDRYYYFDNINSVRQSIRNDGTSVLSAQYDPYGTLISGTVNNYGYASGLYDPTTGYTKFGTRYLNPAIGRWTQPDPAAPKINDTETNNRYAYAQDNPISNTDPTGKDIGDLVGDIGSGIADVATAASSPALDLLGSCPVQAVGLGVATVSVIAATFGSGAVFAGTAFGYVLSVSGFATACG